MERLDPKNDGATPDIILQNIEKLKELFPDAFTEGSEEEGSRWKVDFDALHEILGEYAEDQSERYSFTWNGKSRARLIAQTPSTGTLRPCPEESVNWDTTQNLFVEGDNLEVLKLLQKSYHKKVKMIYIDPPYNTGGDFIYPDDFHDNIKNYMGLTGQTDEEGRKLSVNSETSGRYHTNWLNMMYPRLKLARNLLQDDGVVFISIGDQELAKLELLCAEIFGEENLLGCATRIAKKTSNKGTYFAPSKDYILAYARNQEYVTPFMDAISEEYASRFKEEDDTGHYATVGLYQAALDPMRGCSNQRYWIECPDGSLAIPPGETFPSENHDGAHIAPKSRKDRVWRWNYQSYAEKKKLIVFKRTSTSPLVTPEGTQSPWNVYTKYYLEDRLADGKRPRDYLDDLTNDYGTAALKKYSLDECFDYSKPPELIQRLSTWLADEKSIIVDFFAGSGSTGEGVLRKNIEDNGTRRFVLVQLPEVCKVDSYSAKIGFHSIADICKERLRRVIKKIKEENPEYQGDLGFKVFKLDTSNIKPWDADFDDLDTALFDAVENIKTDRSEDDVLYELLLKYGLDLAVPIEERQIEGKTVYIIGAGVLIVCLADEISLKVVEGIAALKDELKPEIMRVVFKDAGFADDVVKTNAVQILRQAEIEDVKSL